MSVEVKVSSVGASLFASAMQGYASRGQDLINVAFVLHFSPQSHSETHNNAAERTHALTSQQRGAGAVHKTNSGFDLS